MIASFWTSSSVKVCTADRFERRTEGKAEGFERVVIVLAEVSVGSSQLRGCMRYSNRTFVFCATYIAFQYCFLIASRSVQEISTVSAEYQRPNGCHSLKSADS